MKVSFLLLLCVIHQSYSFKLNLDEGNPVEKIRDKRKLGVPVIDQLVDKGIGIKRVEDKENVESIKKDEEVPKKPTLNPVPANSEEVKNPPIPVAAISEPGSSARVKKQSPNTPNLDCGKTACGTMVSARGPVVTDIRKMMDMPQRENNPYDEYDAPVRNAMYYPPSNTRTIDLINSFNPSTYGGSGGGGGGSGHGGVSGSNSGGYGVSGGSGGSGGHGPGYGYSFYKPPPVPQIETGSFGFGGGHPLLHHSMFSQHPTINPHRIQDFLYDNVRQPVFIPQQTPQTPYTPYTQYNPHQNLDDSLICTPYKHTKRIEFQDKIDKVEESSSDKKLNETEEPQGKSSDLKSSDLTNEETIQDHLKKINEIRDQITELNRAAQRIVNQQEELAAMQNQHMFTSHMRSADAKQQPYYGGYYPPPPPPPVIPWSYSRANIASYPDSHEDIAFFMNLLNTAKKMGLLSDSFQSTIIAPVKSVPEAAKSNSSNTNTNTKNTEKHSEDLASDIFYGEKQENKDPVKTKTDKRGKN